MSFRNPLYMQSSKFSYAAVDDRFIIDTLFQEGILNVQGGQGLVVQRPAGAAMQVRVPILDAIIKGDDATNQGSYLVRMDVAEDVDVPAANTTNPRIDLLVVEVVDSSYRTIAAGGFEGVRLRIVTGTPAASPTVPALPATAVPLAQITVAANASSITSANITDARTQAGQASLNVGTQFTRQTTAQRDAISAPFTGQSIFNTTTNRNETYLGAGLGWVSIGTIDAQTFAASGTWTKKAGAKLVIAQVWGAGGGGNSGGYTTTINNGASSRGSGAPGGGYGEAIMGADSLPATVDVAVGAGGLGGIAPTTEITAVIGAAGGRSSFGAYCYAEGGVPSGTTGVGGVGPENTGGLGGAGAAGSNAANGQPGGTAWRAGGGGGAGASRGLAAGSGGAGGFNGSATATSGVGALGTSNAALAGGDGTIRGGGGGGGSSPATPTIKGGNGGRGAAPGGGGGGGACNYTGSASASANGGNGGDGARGEVIVITIY